MRRAPATTTGGVFKRWCRLPDGRRLRRGAAAATAVVSFLLCIAAIGFWVNDAELVWKRRQPRAASVRVGGIRVSLVASYDALVLAAYLKWEHPELPPEGRGERGNAATMAWLRRINAARHSVGRRFKAGRDIFFESDGPNRMAIAGDVYFVGVPYWAAAAALATWPAWYVWRVRRQQRELDRRRRGLCPVCGYDLRASPGRCPECGAAAGGDSGIAGR